MLTTIGLFPKPPGQGRNDMPFPSQARKTANNGLPASVIPEFVAGQLTTTRGPRGHDRDPGYFPNSVFYEVKAVTGHHHPR